MNAEKTITKGTAVKVAIILLIVLALAVTAVLLLKKDPAQSDPQSTQGQVQEATGGEGIDAQTFTVVFKDYDGTVLDTQSVESGKAAKAPADPTRKHFEFAGWDTEFDNITADLVVTATYTTKEFVISAEPVAVQKGAEEVTVNIRVYNNPGLMGAVLKLSVDDAVFACAASEKTGYPGLTLTASGPQTEKSPYIFMLDAQEISGDDMQDGTLFTVTFQVKDAEAAGKFEVALSADEGAFFDKDYKDPEAVLENGSITVE